MRFFLRAGMVLLVGWLVFGPLGQDVKDRFERIAATLELAAVVR